MLPELTPAVSRALETAQAHARRENAVAVGSVHPLHGLLDEEEGLAADLAEPTQRGDAARILDACANRAREGLRVVEDYCRFVLDDRFLTGELKQLRHDLAAVLAELPADLLLAARDTRGDVGTVLTTEA